MKPQLEVERRRMYLIAYECLIGRLMVMYDITKSASRKHHQKPIRAPKVSPETLRCAAALPRL
jgi:hypothetical protein